VDLVKNVVLAERGSRTRRRQQ